ncbi:zinc finger CCCH-type antiviral protein 1-like [Ptychodera flava]|uniref:zinc finger CCCH-type antiviral protein 1-like n=1 Tax=Ptychodera flava TaxID=63121 RepID=UPI00396AA278
MQGQLSSEDSPGGPLIKSLLQLKLCYYYQTENGCKHLNCPRWHLCRDFLSGTCENERGCQKLHKFYSSENVRILEKSKLNRFGEAILQALVNMSFPAICTDYNTIGCVREPCLYLHLCRKYVLGKCTSDCGRSHDETDVSCKQILSKYKLSVFKGKFKKFLFANILLDSKYQEECRSAIADGLANRNTESDDDSQSSDGSDSYDDDDYDDSDDDDDDDDDDDEYDDDDTNEDYGDDDDDDDYDDSDDDGDDDDDNDYGDDDDEDENLSTDGIHNDQRGINQGMNMDEKCDDYSMEVRTVQRENDKGKTDTQSQKKDKQHHHRLKICQENVCQNPIHCEGIHICRDFVSGLCNSHSSCDRSHIFHSPENKKLLSDLHLAGLSESELLKYSSSHLPKVCGKYNRNMCQKDDCNFLHLCQNFVKGRCQTVNPCGFSHKLGKPCNKRILEDHKIQFPVHNKRGVLDTIILDSPIENEAGDKGSGDGIGHGKKCLQKASTATGGLKSSKATADKNVKTQKAKWKAQKKPKVKHKQNPGPEKIPGGRLDQNQESEHSKGASASQSEKFDGDISDTSLPTSLELRLCFFYLQGRRMHVPSCKHIHICREFLSGLCKSDRDCGKSHRFHSKNNKETLVKLNLEKYSESQLHRIAKKSLPKVCSNYNRRECKNKNCEMLHLCQNYVRGVCNDSDVCGLSHQIKRPNNQRTFRRFNINVYVPNINYLSSVLLAKENTGKIVTSDENDESGEVWKHGITSSHVGGNNTAAVTQQVKKTKQPKKEEKKSHVGQKMANKSDNVSKGKKQGNDGAASFAKTGAKHNQDVDCTLTMQHSGQHGRESCRWPVNTVPLGAIPKQSAGVNSKGPVRNANQTWSDSTADPYIKHEKQQIPVTPTVPSRAVPKQLAGISGATVSDTKLTPSRPDQSYQSPSSRPAAAQSSSRNTDPEVEDKKPSFNIASNVESPICVDNLIGKCKNGTLCSNHHCSMPYQWIFEHKELVRSFSDPPRVALPEDDNTAIEKLFCDVAKTRLSISERLYINFKDMSVQEKYFHGTEKQVSQVHRLSTPSYSIADPNSNTACSVATRWKWYFKDVGDIWTPYGLNDSGLDLNDMIETAYLAKESSCSFRTGRFNYTVNFGTAMKQTNLQTLTEREVRRRPAVFVSPTEVKDILTRSLASPVSTPAPSFQFPPSWKPMPKDKEFTRHVLPPSSQRFAFVERRFRKTMDANNTIISIEHIQNPQWWRKYQSQKEIMMKKTPSAELEKYLFHGTEEDTVAKICKQNFDFRVAGKNATMYGHGSYFARDAKYSDNYTRNDASGLKERYMFLAQVLVGRYTQGHSSYKRPPEMNATTGDLYDSCVDKMYNPSIFVIFALDQLYPTYLITYRKEGRSSGLSSHGSTPTARVPSFTQRTAPSNSYSTSSSQSSYSSNQTSNASSTGFRYSSTPQSSSALYSTASLPVSSYSSSQPSSWTSPTSTPSFKSEEPKSSCVLM